MTFARGPLGLLAICVAFITASGGAATGSTIRDSNSVAAQGREMVRLLDAYASHYRARVAGRDTGLPPSVNGHQEFANAWVHDVTKALRGLPFKVIRQQFTTPGFHNLAASQPGANVIVAVPGSSTPQQAFVVGSHYDGEPFSQGSAYDDTSGSMITLEAARVLGTTWRAHGRPARTVEFTLFDSEEQGLYGSVHYAFALRHGALMPAPVFMLDEEQSGVSYPVRPFGLRSHAPLPTYATTSGPLAPLAQRIVGSITPADPGTLTTALHAVEAAGLAAWNTMRATYPTISYRGGKVDTFTEADRARLIMGPDIPICCSDNAPFEALGLPTLTLSGDFQYYDKGRPSWAYPFDQPQDTPQALACDTSGTPHSSTALEAALNLELQMTLRLVATYAPPTAGSGVAVFSTVAAAGKPLSLSAVGIGNAQWAFGDGATGSGTTIRHTYRSAGTYEITVRTSGAAAKMRVTVAERTPVFVPGIPPLRPPPIRPWHPAELQGIAGCK